MDNEIKKYCENCKFYSVLGCKSTLICKDGNRFLNFMCNLTDEEAEIYNKRIEAEAADVQPVKRGRWIYDECCEIVCSECQTHFSDEILYMCYDWNNGKMSFCPKCGADMREATKG